MTTTNNLVLMMTAGRDGNMTVTGKACSDEDFDAATIGAYEAAKIANEAFDGLAVCRAVTMKITEAEDGLGKNVGDFQFVVKSTLLEIFSRNPEMMFDYAELVNDNKSRDKAKALLDTAVPPNKAKA